MNNTLLTEEQQKLLIIDLCGRAPYGTCFIQFPKSGIFPDGMEDTIQKVEVKDIRRIIVNLQVVTLKPYLRRMSSMTEEEKKEYYKLHVIEYDDNGHIIDKTGKDIDWLNEHCFDYRGLIDMGIAIEAPKEMYTFN